MLITRRKGFVVRLRKLNSLNDVMVSNFRCHTIQVLDFQLNFFFFLLYLISKRMFWSLKNYILSLQKELWMLQNIVFH